MLVINHAGTVDVIKTYLSPIRALGVKMKRVENSVNPDDVRNPAFRKVIEGLEMVGFQHTVRVQLN
jgi:hypothetical protein